MRSGHSIKDSLMVTYSTPLQLVAFASTFIIAVQLIVPHETLAAWGFTMAQGEIEVDEDLPNFFEAIKIKHAEEVVLESRNMVENYGFEVEDPQVLQRLEQTR